MIYNPTPSINALLTASNSALSNIDSSSEFMSGVLCGVLITLLAIAIVRLLFWIFVKF